MILADERPGETGVYYFTLVQGLEEEYLREHETIWPEMRSALISAGIIDHSLYHRGDIVIGIFRCVPTIAEAMERLSHQEVVKEWSRHFSRYIAKGVDDSGELQWASRVFALE